jgi:hypothetical protein
MILVGCPACLHVSQSQVANEAATGWHTFARPICKLGTLNKLVHLLIRIGPVVD